MAKTIKLDPTQTETAIKTNDNLLSGLLKADIPVLQECGGRGLCSTCHIFVTEGMDSLSPLNKREQRTLEVITTARPNSRLACQARVLGDGVKLELPAGMYISEMTNIDDLIGRRAQDNILHPLNGKVLVEEGKIITRSMIMQIVEDTRVEVNDYFSRTEQV
ncbi:MAG: 2Fe-2S iron-sulfur cluster binding domain-containing protein [Synechococcaceae cyanobacterium RL_1_2]|nr:2Fe-2S iron-sulfur cluster binding domain-containing protein [Synechococcaceae cyanobacterium RL_1_2]